MHSVLEANDNGNGNMFSFPSYLEMETETRFRFRHSLKWKQKRVSVSIYNKFTLNLCSWLETETCFCFKRASVSIIRWNGNGNLFPFPVCLLFVINLLSIYGACWRWDHKSSHWCFVLAHFPIHCHPPLPPPLPTSNSLQLVLPLSAHNVSAPILHYLDQAAQVGKLHTIAPNNRWLFAGWLTLHNNFPPNMGAGTTTVEHAAQA